MIIGIDAHKYSNEICVLDDAGNTTETFAIANNVPELNNFILKYKKFNPQIAIESSTSGKFVAKTLKNGSLNVHLGNPIGIAAIYSSAKKTDKNDAHILAKLLRLNELPESYLPPEEIDEMRSIVRYRKSLSEDMTAIKNKVHSLLTVNGLTIDNVTDIFGNIGLKQILKSTEKLSKTDMFVMTDLLSRYKDMKTRIEEVQKQLAGMGKEIDEVKLLMSLPGIDYYSAIAIYSEIGDINRFPDRDHLASYTGLVPKVTQSGSQERYGHITKRGPSILRSVIVMAAHTLIKISKRFKKFYLRIVRRLGKNRAIIAVARKLAEIIYMILKKKEAYKEDEEINKLHGRKVNNMMVQGNKVSKIDKENIERLIGDIGIT